MSMNLRTTAFCSALFWCLCSGTKAELIWDKSEIELRPKLGDATAVAIFKYENKGDKPIHINAVRTSCGCTVAASEKKDVAPGEKGEISATFHIGDRTGMQQKTVTVDTDDPTHPSTVLTLKAMISQFLDLQPALVFWQIGEQSKPKTITVKVAKGVAVKSLDVTSSAPDFSAKVEPGPGEGEFRINVQPKDTTRPIAATLTIKPDSAAPGSKPYFATARVTPPAAAIPLAPPNAAIPMAAPPAPAQGTPSAASSH